MASTAPIFGRFGGHDQIGGQRQFQPAADTDPMHGGDDGDGQPIEHLQQFGEVQGGGHTVLGAIRQQLHFGAGAEVTQPTAQQHRARLVLSGPAHRVNQGVEQRDPNEIVRPVLHRQHRHLSVHLAHHRR